MCNRVSGGRTGLEDDIYDASIGKRFRGTIYRPQPSNVVRSRVTGDEHWALRGMEERARRIK